MARSLFVCLILAAAMGESPDASSKESVLPGEVPTPKPKPSQPQIQGSDRSAQLSGSLYREPPLRGLRLVDPLYPPARDCTMELARLGVEFSIPGPLDGTEGCHVPDPVQLRSIRTSMGRVGLPGSPVLDCPFAKQFGLWVSDIAAPVVTALSGARLSSIPTGPGYECRRRTGDNSGKLSEHAKGNAIDIAGFTLSDRNFVEISTLGGSRRSGYRLLEALRISACGYFTTVLGPGSNASHASHFHFDLGRHGRSGKYRICD